MIKIIAHDIKLIFVISSFLVVATVFSLVTFYRLQKARNTYLSPEAFEDSCHISDSYTKIGEIVMFISLIVGLVFFYSAGKNLWRNSVL